MATTTNRVRTSEKIHSGAVKMAAKDRGHVMTTIGCMAVETPGDAPRLLRS